tara:strand:- start:385 stop:807 length:423 start_codon:yes stop_codon:yes gene_type:complete
MTKMSTIRRKFLQNKNSRRLLINLQKDNVISLQGYFPLFRTQQEAINISPELDFHTHTIKGVEYYMPNGLEMGITQFHGDYNNQEIVRPEETVEEVVEPEIVVEEPQVIIPTRTVLPNNQRPSPVYTQPISSSSFRSGGY